MQSYYCFQYKNLLCKADGHGEIEIMSKTRVLNYVGPSRKNQHIGPKGAKFAMDALDLRCHNCKRLLCKARGSDLRVEVKCKHCHELNLFELEKMRNRRLAPLPKIVRDRLAYN